MTAITVRHVPEAVRDELAARAARSGRSLQEYLLAHLIDEVSRPTFAEVLTRARERARLTDAHLDASTILSDRDADRR